MRGDLVLWDYLGSAPAFGVFGLQPVVGGLCAAGVAMVIGCVGTGCVGATYDGIACARCGEQRRESSCHGQG